MFNLNIYALPPFASALVISGIGIYTLLKNPSSKIHRSLFYFCLTLTVWLSGYTLMYCSTTPQMAIKFARIGFIGISFIALTNFLFNVNVLGIQNKKIFIWTLFFISLILSILAQGDFIYISTESFFWGFYPQAGPLYFVFMAYYVSTWAYGLYLLYLRMKEYKNKKNYLAFNQVKYIYIAWLGGSLGIVDFLPKYGVPIYPFAYVIALYWVLICTFAITRYKMLTDISYLTRKLLITSAVFASMFFIFLIGYKASNFVSSKSLSIDRNILIAIVSAITGLLFQPLYQRSKKLIDLVFFPEYLHRKEELAILGQKILLAKNLSEFQRVLLDNLFHIFKTTKASLFLLDDQTQEFRLSASGGWGENHENTDTIKLLQDDEIPKALSESEYILFDEVRTDNSSTTDNRALVHALLKIDALICMQIKLNNKLIGFFVLGDKESGLPYGKDDIKVLKVIAEHTAFALDNLDLSKRWLIEHTEKQQMDKVLHRYLSPSIADEVLSMAHQNDEWKGQRRYVSILVADLRGFTSTTENHSPEDIVEWLNEYLSAMVEIILQNGGTIDKFMGDGVLVVFGAPTSLEKHELCAVKCALEMQSKLISLNSMRISKNLTPLQMGIAITSGNVISGNIGSDKRMEYTVIGDPVNLASRLQSIASPGQILATIDVVQQYSEIGYSVINPIQIKGKIKPVDAVEIKSLKSEYKNIRNKKI